MSIDCSVRAFFVWEQWRSRAHKAWSAFLLFRELKTVISREDKKWLKDALASFEEVLPESSFSERKLKAFSALIKSMVKNMEKNLYEVQKLWNENPDSEAAKQKLSMIQNCLGYLAKYCSEKIEKGGNNG